MDLKLSNKGLPSKLFTPEQVDDLIRNIRVTLPAGTEPVFFGEQAPFDKTLRWQEVDAYGALVGQIKTYNGTSWA